MGFPQRRQPKMVTEINMIARINIHSIYINKYQESYHNTTINYQYNYH